MTDSLMVNPVQQSLPAEHVATENPAAMRRQSAGGFTLIEVLLAIGITATVMLTVGTTFHIMLNARDVVDDLAESSEAGPRILNLIERDLRGLWTYNIYNNTVFKGTLADVNGRDADRMDFLTTTDAVGHVLDLQNEPQKPSICEVGYWFKANPRYRDVFEMWRREDPMVDNELTTEGSFQLVHDRVKSFKVRYYDTLGYESEERLEWDSSTDDQLPKRIKIEFTIERRRSSRNVVSDIELEDFEGAEKTYVRHFVFDQRLDGILAANSARVPVLPGPPEAQEEEGGPAGGGGEAGAGGRGDGERGQGGQRGGGERGPIGANPDGGGRDGGKGGESGQGGGARGSGGGSGSGTGQPPSGLPPGFNLAEFLGGAGGSGNFSGLFGG